MLVPNLKGKIMTQLVYVELTSGSSALYLNGSRICSMAPNEADIIKRTGAHSWIRLLGEDMADALDVELQVITLKRSHHTTCWELLDEEVKPRLKSMEDLSSPAELLKAGSLLQLESGDEYGHQSIGTWTVLIPFDPLAVRKQCREAMNGTPFFADDLIKFLEVQGYIQKVPVTVLRLNGVDTRELSLSITCVSPA